MKVAFKGVVDEHGGVQLLAHVAVGWWGREGVRRTSGDVVSWVQAASWESRVAVVET